MEALVEASAGLTWLADSLDSVDSEDQLGSADLKVRSPTAYQVDLVDLIQNEDWTSAMQELAWQRLRAVSAGRRTSYTSL